MTVRLFMRENNCYESDDNNRTYYGGGRAVTQVGDDYEWLDLSIYSETEHFQLGKVYIVMFSDLEEVQTGLENCFGTGENFDVTGVPEECFRPAGVLENTLMKTIKLADRQ